MTIAKSQGQTCKGRVAVYMPEPVFAHGSLYVALSRVTNPENLRVCLPEGEHLSTKTGRKQIQALGRCFYKNENKK